MAQLRLFTERSEVAEFTDFCIEGKLMVKHDEIFVSKLKNLPSPLEQEDIELARSFQKIICISEQRRIYRADKEKLDELFLVQTLFDKVNAQYKQQKNQNQKQKQKDKMRKYYLGMYCK